MTLQDKQSNNGSVRTEPDRYYRIFSSTSFLSSIFSFSLSLSLAPLLSSSSLVTGIYLVKMARNRKGSGMEEEEVVSVEFLSGDC